MLLNVGELGWAGWGWALSPHGSEAQNGPPCFFSRATCVRAIATRGLSPLERPDLGETVSLAPFVGCHLSCSGCLCFLYGVG